MEQKVNNFTDLIAWQKHRKIVKDIYQITLTFPDCEKFGLTQQIRRSASSIIANIAEGFGRYHAKDKLRFYYFARGSNTETQNHIIIASDLDYINYQQFKLLINKLIEGQKLINGLISSITKNL